MSQDELILRRFESGDSDGVWHLHRSASQDVGVCGPEGAWEDNLRNIGEVYIGSGGDFVVAHIGPRLAAMGGLKLLMMMSQNLNVCGSIPSFSDEGLEEEFFVNWSRELSLSVSSG
ncbi:hypothetical protein ABIB90_008240 [Bradyrhizobium sp. JR4.1]|uniref:hypothetical protein n=1 Tax=unclassified Bradyrhizobium TaxID=2631580 RepID=UPI00339AFC2E